MNWKYQGCQLNWFFKKCYCRSKFGPRISHISISWWGPSPQNLMWQSSNPPFRWLFQPRRFQNHCSRLCVNWDKDINPRVSTLQIRSPRNNDFFLPDPFVAAVHVRKPSERRQLLQQWIRFLLTLGCHHPDLPPVLHSIRFWEWGMALVKDWHALGQKLNRVGWAKACVLTHTHTHPHTHTRNESKHSFSRKLSRTKPTL